MLARLLNFERPTWYRHPVFTGLYLSFLALFGCDTSDKDAPLEIETAKVATEPTPEEKMQANAISYKLLVLEDDLPRVKTTFQSKPCEPLARRPLLSAQQRLS